jgi:hypothetical protein
MRKPLVRTIVAVAAAVAATALGSGVASATVITPGTWTVSPSGAIAAAAGTTTLVAPNATLTCSSSTVSGTAVASATGSPATLASLPAGASTGVKFNGCTGPFGFTFTVTQNGTWLLRGSTYDNVSGVTTGSITSVNARLSGPFCTATVTGTVNATYTNSTKVLQTTTSNLTVTSVSGCLGLLSVGQHPTFNGSYTASTGQTITAVP